MCECMRLPHLCRSLRLCCLLPCCSMLSLTREGGLPRNQNSEGKPLARTALPSTAHPSREAIRGLMHEVGSVSSLWAYADWRDGPWPRTERLDVAGSLIPPPSLHTLLCACCTTTVVCSTLCCAVPSMLVSTSAVGIAWE